MGNELYLQGLSCGESHRTMSSLVYFVTHVDHWAQRYLAELQHGKVGCLVHIVSSTGVLKVFYASVRSTALLLS